MRDAGCHAVRGCGRHNRDAVRGTLYAAVGVVARHAQRKLVGARFHDENVVIVEVVARVRAADVLGAVFAAGFCPDSGLVAHGRVAALPVEVLGLDLRHALRRHNRLGLHLDVKVVDIPAFMRCIEPDGLEARIQRHIQIDVGVRLPIACERDCADHALRRRRRHDGHAVRGSFHAAVRVVARHAQAELVGACVFHIDVVVEHVVACIGAAHVLAAPDVAAGFNIHAGLLVVIFCLDAGDGISAYNRLSHVADVCQLHGKRHRFGGHDKAIHLIPGNFHHLQCSAVRIHRLDRLHGLSCRQAGDGNRHGLAQSRLCRRAQGCFLPVRHLDRIGLARGCAVDLPEFHVVDLHGGMGIAQAIEGDRQLAVLHFHLGGIPLIPAVVGDLHLCCRIAVVAGQLHAAGLLPSVGHFHRCVHLVCALRQPGDRLVQTPFKIACGVEIELIVAAECVRLVHAIAHVGEVVHRPIRGVAAFKAAVRDGDLRHHHGRVAHRDVVQDDVARIACSAGDRQRVLSRVEMDGHRDLIPEPPALQLRENHLLGVRFIAVRIDVHRPGRPIALAIADQDGVIALFRDGNIGEGHALYGDHATDNASIARIPAKRRADYCTAQHLSVFAFVRRIPRIVLFGQGHGSPWEQIGRREDHRRCKQQRYPFSSHFSPPSFGRGGYSPATFTL